MSVRMLWAFCLVTLISQGEIIDRIAVAVGNQVITESEILRDIRITAFLNDTELDFSPKAKRRAADRLVEQKLVNKEMELTKYPGPEPEDRPRPGPAVAGGGPSLTRPGVTP